MSAETINFESTTQSTNNFSASNDPTIVTPASDGFVTAEQVTERAKELGWKSFRVFDESTQKELSPKDFPYNKPVSLKPYNEAGV
jgi:hypothetical protein